jgi:hypothetical protein
MALMALNRSFIFKIMARDADLMCDFLVPAINDSDFGFVAVVAVIMRTCLVLPMLEPEFHNSHLEIDNFTATIFRWICQNRRKTSRGNKQPGHQQCTFFHNPTS